MDSLVKALYRLLRDLPRHDHTTPKDDLPSDGIYFFFEAGESVEIDGGIRDRIVRVGTHRVDGRFATRIRQHYGNKNSLHGNKNGSVFRKHVGGALLRKENDRDPRLKDWITQMGDSYPEVEREVSQTLRSNFTFVSIEVPTKQDRLDLEAGLIGLLVQHPDGKPSSDWLGHHAVDPAIRTSGLWNTQHISAPPLSEAGLARLKQLANGVGVPQSGVESTNRSTGFRPTPREVPPAEEESVAETLSSSSDLLVIIPCGQGKVWDRHPEMGPAQAKDAYTGAPFTVNREYAETFATRWVILSAKYGFVDPDFRLPGPYNLTFKRRHPELVTVETLREQVKTMGLDAFADVVALGGKEYQKAVREAFSGTGVTIHTPFAGLRMGEAMGATKRAVRRGDPLFREE